MQIVCKNLVSFDKKRGLIHDHCAIWLKSLGFLSPEVEKRIIEAKFHLPIDVETDFRSQFGLPIKDDITLKTLNKLLGDENGIPLGKFNKCEIEGLVYLESKLLLVRQDDSRRVYKPLAPAFNPGVQYLIGLKPVSEL